MKGTSRFDDWQGAISTMQKNALGGIVKLMKSKNLSLSALNEEVRYFLRRNCAVIGSEKNILVNMVGCGYFLADII
jgi:hypothetical protein